MELLDQISCLNLTTLRTCGWKAIRISSSAGRSVSIVACLSKHISPRIIRTILGLLGNTSGTPMFLEMHPRRPI